MERSKNWSSISKHSKKKKKKKNTTIKMRFVRTISIVGCHAEGEVGDVIIGGVLDVPGKTMYDKLVHFRTQDDGLRQLLLNEPRGRSSMNTNLVMAPFATPAPTPASSSWRAGSARPYKSGKCHYIAWRIC